MRGGLVGMFAAAEVAATEATEPDTDVAGAVVADLVLALAAEAGAEGAVEFAVEATDSGDCTADIWTPATEEESILSTESLPVQVLVAWERRTASCS